jgi:hypothetical protein
MKPPAGLLIEVDGPEGKGGKSPSEPPEAGSDFDAALDDAFEASKRGDKQAFVDAMGAAISAKCAEMYGPEESES